MKIFEVLHEVTDNEWESYRVRSEYFASKSATINDIFKEVEARDYGYEHCQRLISVKQVIQSCCIFEVDDE